jgi:hypothetical protein
MTTANFQSNGPNGTVFRILADMMTVTDLIDDIVANCSGSLSNSSISAGGSPSSYNDSSTLPPQPEQIVQYYRASSIAVRFFVCSAYSYLNTEYFSFPSTDITTRLSSKVSSSRTHSYAAMC